MVTVLIKQKLLFTRGCGCLVGLVVIWVHVVYGLVQALARILLTYYCIICANIDPANLRDPADAQYIC
jgi:hypothetical protein